MKLSQLLSGSSIALSIKFSGLVFGFLLHAMLARNLTVVDYGMFTVCISLAALLSIVSRFAIDRSIVRLLVEVRDEAGFETATGLYRWAIVQTLIASTLVAVALTFISVFNVIPTLYLACLFLMLTTSMTLISQGVLRSYNKTALALFPEQLGKHLLAVLLVGIVFIYKGDLVFSDAITIFSTASAVMMLTAFVITYRAVPRLVVNNRAKYQIKDWYVVSAPIFWSNLMSLGELHILILISTIFLPIDQVAILSVIIKIAAFSTLSTLAVSMYVSPIFTRQFRSNDIKGLRRTTRDSARICSVPMIPIILIVIIFGVDILEFFGAAYSDGYSALVIIFIAKSFTCLFGPVGALLSQSAFERKAALTFTISLLVTLSLTVILSPWLGMLGVALALLGSMVMRSLLNWYFAKRYLNVSSFVL